MPAHTVTDNMYILITQCMQNNFFLAHENRLCLPEDIAMRILVNNALPIETKEMYTLDVNRRKIKPDLVKNGPLGQFLQTAIDSPDRQNDLHVIHIKDWHVSSPNYDFERRSYGAHCEAGSWEAESIEGLDKYLQPWKGLPGARAKAHTPEGYRDEKTVYYEIMSDSLFDFRPPAPGQPALLSQILDRLVFGDGLQKRNVYIAVIGVLTDIKIKTLLTGLRTLYEVDNLILSDVLTASSTLERHLSGLDYADKVLNVEVVHPLNDLVSILNPYHGDTIPENLISKHVNFRDYRLYYLDKQNVLAYQDQKLIEYIELTSQRGSQVYQQVFQTNRNLTRVGFVFLAITALLAIVSVLFPERVKPDAALVTGGLSMVQLLAGFFYNPLSRLQENLNNLVRLRNYLETYSTLTALLRHHLTQPEHLQNKDLEHLKQQMEVVQQVAAQMSANFSDIQLKPAVHDDPNSA